MWRIIFSAIFCTYASAYNSLWPKGVVHFDINTKDYDLHSQDIILSTLAALERELCVKFFHTPPQYNASVSSRVLYITNPDKRKDCPPINYDFSAGVVDMPIGYKCLDSKNIARVVVDMLRASIKHTAQPINSFDLVRTFQEMQADPTRPYLLSPSDRNFINAHYHAECGVLSQRAPLDTRRTSARLGLSTANEEFYSSKLWPYGVVMYAIEEKLKNSSYAAQLQLAMTTIESASCVVFREMTSHDAEVIEPRNMLYFGDEGESAPAFGFTQGKQVISLKSMSEGAPGHCAHTLNLLLRALAVPMMSNRADRDNYVIVNWKHVEKGKEFFLEKTPVEAWVRDARLPYDFESASHAPANFMCGDCSRGQATVAPAHDHLWQRVIAMGHTKELSDGDKLLLAVLYEDKCRDRQAT